MFGERIKYLRKERELTQAQLGELLQCGQRTVSKYEAEQIDLGTQVLIKLCQIFEVSADYILGIEDETGAKKFR